MVVDWRALLDSLNVPWKDRGRNCSTGKVNIKCPFCPDDPSEHLSISESHGTYSCWRDPAHWGHGEFLLTKLGLNRVKAVLLMEEYKLDADPKSSKVLEEKRLEARKAPGEWNSFDSASDYDVCLDYLYGRGFPNPEAVCDLYDLRYAPTNRTHKRRLLFPLTRQDVVLGWTGRGLYSNMVPKYLTKCEDTSRCFAGELNNRLDTAFVVEGPMDALKLNFALRGKASAAAMCGKGMSVSRLLLLMNCCFKRIYICTDYDVPIKLVMSYIKEVECSCMDAVVRRAALVNGYKDTGAMPIDVIQDWYEELEHAE